MHINKKLMALLLLLTSSTAMAGTSASIGFANMYLWRGQNVSPDGPTVSGSLDYKHEKGGYAGIWTTSEFEGHETDLYAGFGASMGKFGVDISYWKYLYPEDGPIAKTDLSEIVLGLSYGPAAFTTYYGVESGADADIYFTLAGSLGKFTLTYGFWVLENSGGDDYSHVQLGYDATDKVSFAVSKAFSSLDAGGVEEDPLFMVSYGLSFDLK